MSEGTITVGLAPWVSGDRIVGYPCRNAGDCFGCVGYVEFPLGDSRGEASIVEREVPGEGVREVVIVNE